MVTPDEPLRCRVCGRELRGDPDDDSNLFDGPICGDCAREDEFVQVDLLDGILDGRLDAS